MKRKIALIYDRANTAYGGAERVLLALKSLYPEAVLFTSVYNKRKAKWLKDFEVKATFLQKIPFAKHLHRYLANLMPLAFENLDLEKRSAVHEPRRAHAPGERGSRVLTPTTALQLNTFTVGTKITLELRNTECCAIYAPIFPERTESAICACILPV